MYSDCAEMSVTVVFSCRDY